mmetsp:Transcript_25129/g.44034  ORF Transcript_25129/g.44034 Transcript_25129/m.44034 type:complete len:201 (+) Transcript_25129:64-666(+)
MLRGCVRRLMSELENVSYQRIPIRPLNIEAPPPTPEDFMILETIPSSDNKFIIMCYKELKLKYHPEHDPSAAAQAKWQLITEAYDRIMLHRMAEQGIPELYTPAYRGQFPTSNAISALINESVFEPYVPENYVTILAVFWALFGLCHSLFNVYDPLDINETLAEDANLEARPYYFGIYLREKEKNKERESVTNLLGLKRA